MNTAQGFGQRVAAYRPTKGLLFWAAAAGAVATIVVGFAWGGWVTGGSAKRVAEAAPASARDPPGGARSGRGKRTRHAGGSRLRRPVPGRRRCPGPARGAEAAAGLRPRLLHREGRM